MKAVSGSTHQNRPEDIKGFLHYFEEKREQKFWGEVLVKFRNGVPYLIKEIRQIKLSSE